MAFEHCDRLITLFAVGLGLLLTGGLNLVLGSGGRRAWLRWALTVGLCVALSIGVAASVRLELAFRTAEWLAGVLLVVALASSERLARQLAALVASCRKPAVRWGLVSLGGVAVVVGAQVAYEFDDRAAMDETVRSMELAIGRPPSRPIEGPYAATDLGNRIVLREPVVVRTESDLTLPEERTLNGLRLNGQLIRKSGPADQTNCHGWVFTGGKFILGPEDVEQIIKENGYSEVQAPHAGDLIVYRQEGQITHTAVVRYVSEGQPVLVEGKWGVMGVFLHPADKSCYGSEYSFYRSHRQGHLLVGLGGSAPTPSGSVPPGAVPAITE